MSETTESLDNPQVSQDADAATGTAKGRARRGSGLSGMVLADLKALAGQLGIKGTSGMRKGDLVAAIAARQNGAGAATPSHDGGSSSTSTDSPAAVNGSAGHGSQPDSAGSDSAGRNGRAVVTDPVLPLGDLGDGSGDNGGGDRGGDGEASGGRSDTDTSRQGGDQTAEGDEGQRGPRRNRRGRRDGREYTENGAQQDRGQQDRGQQDRGQQDRAQQGRDQDRGQQDRGQQGRDNRQGGDNRADNRADNRRTTGRLPSGQPPRLPSGQPAGSGQPAR